MIDLDDWSDGELTAGNGYATTCARVFSHQLDELRTLEVLLSLDKRAVVEISVLLDLAAKLAQEQLRYNADDFAISACDVFTRRAR